MIAIDYGSELDARVGGAHGWCRAEQIQRPKALRALDIDARRRQLAESSIEVSSVDSLLDSNLLEIRFHTPLQVALRMDEQAVWHCNVPALNVEGQGGTREKAKASVADIIRRETDRFLHTMSHTLDNEELDRKGVFLGSVDVVVSGISKPMGEFAWVAGVVEIDADGKATFRQDRTDGEVYELAADVPIPNDSFVRMGKVRQDMAGYPVGHVLELGEPLDDDPEGTLARWTRLTSNEA